MTSPHHRQTLDANKIVNWVSSDTQDEYDVNLLRHPEKLQEHGWLGIDIEYRFNSEGFRTDEFVEEGRFLAFGCSFTSGEGLPLYQIWSTIVSDHLRIPYYNLGVCGASNMTMFRLAEYWIPKLNPPFVILQTTYKERFEIIYSKTHTETYTVNSNNHTKHVTSLLRDWWSNDDNGRYDSLRNKLAIQQLCAQQGIPCYMIDIEDFEPKIDLARDLLHAGPKTHQRVARQVLEMIK